MNGRIASSNGLVITRDAIGRIASIVYAPGKTVTYAYNARGLLASVADWAGGSAAFTYDAAARVTSITRANGVVTQISYDANSRISTLKEVNGATTLASIALQRDALGRVTSADRTLPQEPMPALGAFAQSFDAAAQLSGASYDGLGRITQDPRRTYAWNLASELTAYASPGESASFGYDAFGLRTSRTSGGSTDSYVLNYAPGPAIDRDRADGRRGPALLRLSARWFVALCDRRRRQCASLLSLRRGRVDGAADRRRRGRDRQLRHHPVRRDA